MQMVDRLSDYSSSFNEFLKAEEKQLMFLCGSGTRMQLNPYIDSNPS